MNHRSVAGRNVSPKFSFYQIRLLWTQQCCCWSNEHDSYCWLLWDSHATICTFLFVFFVEFLLAVFEFLSPIPVPRLWIVSPSSLCVHPLKLKRIHGFMPLLSFFLLWWPWGEKHNNTRQNTRIQRETFQIRQQHWQSEREEKQQII